MSFFQFREFGVRQKDSAMKVGTDGVLLGAWAPGRKTDQYALDIGTGTGLISLMLAQRFQSMKIDAVEVDALAAQEAKFNFENSTWFQRLSIFHSSFADFCLTVSQTYDLIVCNPPFFSKSQTTNSRRAMARQAHYLPFEQLFKGVSQMLAYDGQFALIVSTLQVENCINHATNNSLYLINRTVIKGHREASVKRQLLCFSSRSKPLTEDELVLEQSRHKKTKSYHDLVNDFYLPKD